MRSSAASFILAIAACMPQRAPAAFPSPAGAVAVYPDSAVFTFPSTRRADFRWNDASVPPVEYYWWATVLGTPTPHRVGFQIVRRSGASPESGSLERLFEGAVAEVSEAIGGPMFRAVPHSAALEVRTGRAVLILRDSKAVARVFGSRPGTVIYIRSSLGEPLDTDTATVAYHR